MSRTVFDLEGKVGLEDKNFIAKAKRVKQSLTDIQNKFKRVSNTGAGLRRPTKEYQALERQVRQAEKAVEDLKKSQARQAAKHKQSDEYKTLQKDITVAEAELDKLIEKQITWAESGISPSSAPFQELDAQIERARLKLEEMKTSLAAIAETGATEEEARDWFKTADAIDKAEAELKQYRAQQAAMSSGGSTFQKATSGLKNFGKTFAAGTFLKAGKALGKMIAPQKRVANGFKNISRQATKMKKGLFMGAGIKGLLRFGVAGAVALYSVRMLKQGLENLRAYDARTNASINQMSASLATLKNALATAFAPILNVVAPILAQFIDWLTAAVTAIAHFMAALTGQSQVTIARKGISGVGAAASDAAGSTNDANDAAKEYQKTLMGFDQINKLDEPTSGSGGGGGGGGGGVGGAGSMFETVPVDSAMSNLADIIREAWANADFTELGAMLAEKMNEALENIPWDKIQATCQRLAKSVGTFINGFVENFDWGLLAKSISLGIETAIDTVTTLITTIHWQSIGKAIVDFIAGIDYGGLLKSASGFAGAVLGAATALVQGIVEAIGEKISGYFKGKIEEAGGNIVQGIFNGIVDAIAGIGNWIHDNLFQPFIDGFKNAFGINSPSTVMKEQGHYIIDGLIQGLQDKIGEILDWFRDLPNKIKDFLADLGMTISVGVGLVKDGWTSLKDWVGDTISAAVSLIKSGWTSITGFVGSAVTAAVSLAKSGWSSIAGFVGTAVWVGISLYKNGWKSISSFVGTTVKVGIKLVKSGWKTIKKFLGLKKGGKFSLSGKKVSRLNADGGIMTGGSWKPVTAAANGGSFNQGQMFIAREAGPELVGTLNGHTAVMNNNQIVSSVSDGVARAMANVLQHADLGGSEVTINMSADMAQLFRIVQEKAIDYTRATGQPAFPV